MAASAPATYVQAAAFSVASTPFPSLEATSPRSWSDAARQAVATASKTVRNIQTVEVVKSTAVVRDGEIVEYRVEVKIGFEYEGA